MEDDGAKVFSESTRSQRYHPSSSFHASSPHQPNSAQTATPVPSTSLLRNDGAPLSASPNAASGQIPRRTGSISSSVSVASSSADSTSTVGGGGGGDALPSDSSRSESSGAGSGTSGSYVRVLFDYQYTKKDGTKINITRDQIYHLVDKTNDVWWRVRPTSKTVLAPEMKSGKAFYLPANYVEIENDTPTQAAPTGNSSNGSRNSSRNGSLKSASSSSSSAPRQQQHQHVHQLARSSTPPQRYENWNVKNKVLQSDASTVPTSSLMSVSLPPAAAATATSNDNIDYSSKKSVAEKRQSFELMSSSTSSIGSVTAHVPVNALASSLSFQPSSTMSQSQSSFNGAVTLPVAVPNIDGGRHPDDYDEVDDEFGVDGGSGAAHSQNRPLPRVPDPSSHEGGSQHLTSSHQPTNVSSSSRQPKTHHQQSSSYDSGIDNPCYARLDELKQQMMATSISILGGSGSESTDKKLDDAGSGISLEPEDEKTGSSDTLDTEDSQSIPDLDVLDIGGGGRSSFKSNSKPINLSSFKNPLYQQQQQQPNPRESGGSGSPLSSFGSLEKRPLQRQNLLSDSSDDVFDDFMKKSSLLNSFAAASTSTSSSSTNAASSLKSKAATLTAVEPPRVPATALLDSSLSDPAPGTKSLERDELLPKRMESIGGGGGSVSGVSRQRPNSFNYMGVKGSGVDMGVLKNQLRKTSSREMLAERDGCDDDVKEGDDDDDENLHRRRTVEETRKSLEDLSAAVENESWKTKSCEHLLGGKSKRTRKEKLPPGWTKDFDSELARDIYVFKNGDKDIRWLSEKDEAGHLYYYAEDGNLSLWRLPINPLMVKPDQPDSLLSEEDRSRGSSCSLDPDADGSVNDDSLSTSGEFLNNGRNRSNSSADNISSANVSPHSLHSSTSRPEALRKGHLNYTKYQYGQKKLNKNWNKAYVVLISDLLLFYANEKKAKEVKNYPFGKHEFKIDLIGGKVEDGKDKTRRNNALLVTAFTTGSKNAEIQVLLQSDSSPIIEEWKADLQAVCSREQDSAGSELGSPTFTPEPSPTTKVAIQGNEKDDGSDISSKTSIFGRKRKKSKRSGAWLENWFRRRPTMESVKEKGLLKSRVVFGANVETLALREKNRVPSFVVRCTSALETRDALRVDGIYRINGNTADIQKLRFLVDEGQPYDLLDSAKWDVHTLSGALKLFFRELEQPLIPWNVFEKALEILRSGSSDRLKAKSLASLLNKQMPPASRSTLVLLCKHLVKVVALKSENRMQASNLAICFGPTLIWSTPAAEEAALASGGNSGGANIAINMMNQSQIVEFLLSNCEDVFLRGDDG